MTDSSFRYLDDAVRLALILLFLLCSMAMMAPRQYKLNAQLSYRYFLKKAVENTRQVSLTHSLPLCLSYLSCVIVFQRVALALEKGELKKRPTRCSVCGSPNQSDCVDLNCLNICPSCYSGQPGVRYQSLTLLILPRARTRIEYVCCLCCHGPFLPAVPYTF